MATAVEPWSLDTIKEQVVEPLAELIRRGNERELELRGEVEEAYARARAEVAEIRLAIADIEKDVNGAKSTLRRFDPDHELVREEKKKGSSSSNGNGSGFYKPKDKHLAIAKRLLEQDGQMTIASLKAVLAEKDPDEKFVDSRAQNMLGWMRKHELIRFAGKLDGTTNVFKSMEEGEEDAEALGVSLPILEQAKEAVRTINPICAPTLTNATGWNPHRSRSALEALVKVGYLRSIGPVQNPRWPKVRKPVNAYELEA